MNRLVCQLIKYKINKYSYNKWTIKITDKKIKKR